MRDIGEQYPKDNITDKSGFLSKARLHQSKFRAEILNVDCDTYGNYLLPDDGGTGLNFYSGFGVFEAVKARYPKYSKPLYSNMLRSEHIPFNFFIPLNNDKGFCKNVFNEILSIEILSIDRVEIEYAPKPSINYLNDATSFDAYIEYTTTDKTSGIIGIEVKYTEQEYKISEHSKEKKDIDNPDSLYYKRTNECGLFKQEDISKLKSDNFRQVWRNHLLGESILIEDKDNFSHFTSMTFFPKDNLHFTKVSKEYMNMLLRNDNNFIPITYEHFFELLKKYCPNDNFRNWIDYLEMRYIINIE